MNLQDSPGDPSQLELNKKASDAIEFDPEDIRSILLAEKVEAIYRRKRL